MIELLLLAVALSFVFGWNNSSFLIGNLTGSGTLTTRSSVILAMGGILAGVLLEGSKMVKSLDGTLAPSATPYGLTITFAVTLAVTLALTALALPASISAIMVGAFLGVTVSSGIYVNLGQTYLIIAFWFVAPLLAGVIAFALHRGVKRLVANFSLVGVDSFNRVFVVATSLAVAYSLGANNVGLIYGTALGGVATGGLIVAIGLTLVAMLGTALLGKRNVSGTLGDRMLVLSPQGVLVAFASSALLVWGGTQLRVPMSITQCLLGGMLGAAFSSKVAVVNRRITFESISTWVITPLLAFVTAYLVLRI